MAEVHDVLVATPPREKAGARTFARYQFQASFSLLEMLARHEAGADYRALFDYFDDLLVLDSSNGEANAIAYQLKGRDTGAWSISALTASEDKGDLPRSIVGRMYFNVQALGTILAAACFVSNAPFKLALSTGNETTPDHDSIVCSSLSADARAKISAALDADFPKGRDHDHEPIFRFMRTELGTKGFDKYVKGRLAEYFATSGVSAGVISVYEALITEIVERSMDTGVYTDVDELNRRKSLCRSDVELLLAAAVEKDTSILDSWTMVQAELLASGKSPMDVLRLQNGCHRYTQSLRRGDLSAREFSTKCRSAGEALVMEISAAKSLGEIVEILRPLALPYANLLPPKDLDSGLFAEAFEFSK